jgi:glycosyltransferase involved in cell wall biosynthesis
VAYGPDVVISAEFGMRTIQAAMYCFLFRKPLIVWATLSESTERNRGGMRHALRRVLLRFVDRVLVNGSSGARYIAGFGFPKERIHIVPQASDNAAFAGPATRTRGDVTQLLYTGQLIERKGLSCMHEALLRWCSAHPDRRVRWTIVGSGPLRETVESWRGLANYELEVLGPLPFASIAAEYHAADLYAFPSLADEWGLVVNEAMIAGLPVLGSVYSQAVLDAVVGGVNGWTFHPDQAEELDRALDRALSTSEDGA